MVRVFLIVGRDHRKGRSRVDAAWNLSHIFRKRTTFYQRCCWVKSGSHADFHLKTSQQEQQRHQLNGLTQCDAGWQCGAWGLKGVDRLPPRMKAVPNDETWSGYVQGKSPCARNCSNIGISSARCSSAIIIFCLNAIGDSIEFKEKRKGFWLNFF